MNKKLLCPSMMCCDFGKLKQEVTALEEAGVDIFHCDIMDGNFVQNMALASNDIKALRSLTDQPIDIHLMIDNPGQKIDWFVNLGADIIYIHPEAERYVSKTLRYIRSKGKMPGLALNPDTSIESVYEMLKACDYVLVMTVDPGFAGQQFIDTTVEKIKVLVKLKEVFHFKIIIDGSCSVEVIQKLSAIGADGFVLGTSALFGKNRPYSEIIKELRAL